MFINLFLPVFSLLQCGSPSKDARSRCNIALAAGVSASGVRRRRFDQHALLAHDLAHKHPFKSRLSKENIHETQSDRRRRNDGHADAARPSEQHRR
jgi:hypothetical protein